MSTQYSILGNRPLDQWKVAELRDELRRRKITTSGVKAELVRRLDEAVREELGNGLSLDSDNQDGNHEPEMEFHEDKKDYNPDRSEFTDDYIKTTLGNAKMIDKDSTMVDCDDSSAITGQGNTAQIGESTMVNLDENNAVTGQGNRDQMGESLGVFDSDGPANLNEDNNDCNSNRGEFTDNSIKTVSKNAEKRDGDSTIVDFDDKNAITGQGIATQLGESTMVDIDDNNAITGEGSGAQAGGSLGSFDSDGPGNLNPDNKDYNSNRSEFTDDSIKTVSENAEKRDEDSTIVDFDDKNAITGQGIEAEVGESTTIDADDNNAVTCQENSAQPGGPLGSFDPVGVAEQTAVLTDSAGNNIEISHNELTQSGQDKLMDDRAHIANEGSEPTVESAKLDVSNPNNQVSKVNPVFGFQLTCESISTDSITINEKIELKDGLNADNFHLEVEVVKPEILYPSSGDVPPNAGDLHLSGDQEPGGNQNYVEEMDDNNAANIELSKKNDSADGASSEKLNLDRSSGDDSLEDEGLESKQIDSVHNSNEAGYVSQNLGLHPVKEESPVDAMTEGFSPEKKDNIAEKKDLSISIEKRKNEDQEAVGINEPSKRQRRWFPEQLKVSEPETSHPTPSSTPREKITSAPKRVLAKSDSNLSIDSPKERVVPQSQKPVTNSLRIDRFLRPFTLKAVQDLLAKTGTVSSFWMDHIKTHCYVTYSSVEEAVATRNSLYNLQWPPNGGRLLTAEFVDPQEVKTRVEAPQAPVPAAAAPSSSQPSPRQQLPPPPTIRERLPAPAPAPAPAPTAKKPEPPTVTLDDLFRKTRATPRIYWLPLSEEQVYSKLAVQRRNNRS